MKQTLLMFAYLVITFTGCKKEEPQPTSTTSTLYVSDPEAKIEVNGVEDFNRGQTITLTKGDVVRVYNYGADSWNPSDGYKNEGRVNTTIYINGKSVFSQSCNCDTDWTKTF